MGGLEATVHAFPEMHGFPEPSWMWDVHLYAKRARHGVNKSERSYVVRWTPTNNALTVGQMLNVELLGIEDETHIQKVLARIGCVNVPLTALFDQTSRDVPRLFPHLQGIIRFPVHDGGESVVAHNSEEALRTTPMRYKPKLLNITIGDIGDGGLRGFAVRIMRSGSFYYSASVPLSKVREKGWILFPPPPPAFDGSSHASPSH